MNTFDVLSAYSNMPKIKVSDYCVGADKEPDIEKLEEDVKTFKGNCLLLGLGDYLASKGTDAKKNFNPIQSIGFTTTKSCSHSFIGTYVSHSKENC